MSDMEAIIGSPENPKQRAFVYMEDPDDLSSVFAMSNTIPQSQVRDALYAAFVQACKNPRSKVSRAEMSLPIGKILDLL